MNLQELYDKVDAHKEDMISTWQSLVNRDCGTANKAGVDEVGKEIAVFLKELGFAVSFKEYKEAGNMLIATYGEEDKPFVVLTGHMDTVFADGTAKERPFKIENGKVTGPGVLDMKGGVTILLYAVKFLVEAGYDKYRLKIILAGDEEVGHGKSTAAEDYREEVKGALMGFNMETSFIDNSIVVERKGVAQFMLDVDGIGAHAGNNPEEGRSAVEELAHKILDIQALTDYEEGTTVNTGVIGGGTVANAVPEHAFAKIDVRFKEAKGLKRVEKALEEMTEKQYVEGTITHLTKLARFGAMEKLPGTDTLFERANEVAISHGFPKMKAIAVGGGSDSACLTAAGVPTLCALGVKGQYNHTVREWAEESSLYERTKLLITLLSEL